MSRYISRETLVETAIDNCFVTYHHGYPGTKDGLCLGFSDIKRCNLCKLMYKEDKVDSNELGYNPYQE